MKKTLGYFFMFILLFYSITSLYAANYVLPYSAVDDYEIRWGGSTKYGTQWNYAVSKWNELNYVNVAKDTLGTYQDLTINDVYYDDVVWTGEYSNSAGSDDLKFNKYYLDEDVSSQQKNTLMHELGHALGLAHSFAGNIMVGYQTSINNLGTQDIKDYNHLWSN